jgi:hypothetical protein
LKFTVSEFYVSVFVEDDAITLKQYYLMIWK